MGDFSFKKLFILYIYFNQIFETEKHLEDCNVFTGHTLKESPQIIKCYTIRQHLYDIFNLNLDIACYYDQVHIIYVN
jgi:hypothetical protein